MCWLFQRDDDVPGDVLKLLGEGGLKTLTKLMNTIYEKKKIGEGWRRSVGPIM
jgi:hypothetical protein